MASTFTRILGWLRAGYPEGVPREDYIALFGVLQRHLTEPEIVTLVEQIRAANGDAPISDEEIRRRIGVHLLGHASEDDVRRVATRLTSGGWQLPDDLSVRGTPAPQARSGPKRV